MTDTTDAYADRYARWYGHITRSFREHPTRVRWLNFADKALVYLIAAIYLGILVAMAVTADARFVRMALVPAVAFVLCTAIRAGVNAPRPYERCTIQPLIHKDTHGKSFPSRHIASAAVISCAIGWLSPIGGVAAFAGTAIVCYCRIVGGVHFPRDVVGALALAIVCGIVGFVLIP